MGFPDGNTIGSTVYDVGEKPTVILYTYINRHAGTPEQRQNDTMNLDTAQFCYIGIGIGSDGCQHYFRVINHQTNHSYRLTRQKTMFCFLINYQVNLTARG